MNWIAQLRTELRVRLLALARRGHLRDRVDEEMKLHLELRVERLMEAGLARSQAIEKARAEFGNPVVIRETTLDMWRYATVETFLQDARYGVRLLLRNPIFALTAALSLAIGIGANTTVFSVANRLLLRDPIGVADPGRLVDIGPTADGGRFVEPVLPYPFYLEIQQRASTLESVYGYQFEPQPMSLAGPGGAERIFSTTVTGNYFTSLGVRAPIGRVFDSDDAAGPTGDSIVVLSHGFWTRRFSADPSLVGQSLQLNGRPYTVVGVAPEGFQGISVVIADLWIPMAVGTPGDSRLVVGGRLKPGVTVRQAAAEIDAIGRTLSRELPLPSQIPGMRENRRGGLGVAGASAIPPVLRTPIAGCLALLMGIVSLVLVIACANIAGVLLARATARRREIAVRLAIGAGRGRLIRQLLTETFVLFVLGGAAGVALARLMTSLLVTVLPSTPVPIDVSLPLDGRVILFTAGLSLVAAVLSGLVPALQASKSDVVSSLKNDSQGPSDRLRLRSAFVVAQVAFSILLVVGAGLFVRALQRTGSVQLGYDPRGVEVAYLDLGLAGYTNASGPLFVRDLTERLRALPGVQDATVAVNTPSESARRIVGGLRARDGQQSLPAPSELQELPSSNLVGSGYFSTLRIPLVSGRDFTAADRDGTQPVAIVSEAAAREYWPGQTAIGQHLPWRDFGARGAAIDLLIVGVARDLRTTGRGKDRPLIYLPLLQRYRPTFAIFARPVDGQRVTGEIRALIASMNSNLPIVSSRMLDDESSPGLTQLRVSASVSGTVGLVGLLLAGIGIYGVTAYTVTQRTREIGVRIALGAQRSDVLRMVLRQGMVLVAIGSAIGLLFAAAASRLVVRLLFGVPPLDPLTFGGAALLFAAIGLAACYVPARRATRIDAMEALRHE
jgi:predicted permease